MHSDRRVHLVWSVCALALAGGCAPVYQDARMIGPGRFEMTPSYSGTAVTRNGGESGFAGHTFALQAGFGVHERADVSVAYARLELEDDDFEVGLNALGLGPKFGIVPDRFAVAIPVSFVFGDDVPTSETWQIHPTAIVTIPLNNHVDFNSSARLTIGLCDSCNTLVGLQGGLGLRPRSRITLRRRWGFCSIRAKTVCSGPSGWVSPYATVKDRSGSTQS